MSEFVLLDEDEDEDEDEMAEEAVSTSFRWKFLTCLKSLLREEKASWHSMHTIGAEVALPVDITIPSFRKKWREEAQEEEFKFLIINQFIPSTQHELNASRGYTGIIYYIIYESQAS